MLRTQPGIHSVKVALLAERGVVEYDPDVWTPEKIVGVCDLLNSVGFDLPNSISHCRKYLISGSTQPLYPLVDLIMLLFGYTA